MALRDHLDKQTLIDAVLKDVWTVAIYWALRKQRDIRGFEDTVLYGLTVLLVAHWALRRDLKRAGVLS